MATSKILVVFSYKLNIVYQCSDNYLRITNTLHTGSNRGVLLSFSRARFSAFSFTEHRPRIYRQNTSLAAPTEVRKSGDRRS